MITQVRLEHHKKDIKSMTLMELEEEMTSFDFPRYRAKQIYQWMHMKSARQFAQMSDLPKEMRNMLAKQYEYTSLQAVKEQISRQDGTRKYLFQLSDHHFVESVLMNYHYGNTVCISSQVGCRMGCRFCASAIDGFERNLKPSEMLDQIYAIEWITGERINNVVVMGTGEPLDNYDHLLTFIRLLSDENGHHISQRNITVSTCGIVPMIKKLAREKLQITLALSLHAPTDEKRRQIMPIAQRYPLSEVISACKEYFRETGRRITFEYSLIRGINDTKKDAGELSKLLEGFPCHINLIPINPVLERNFERSTKEAIRAFQNELEKNGNHVTIRRSLGNDIDGACGQLRKRQQQKSAQ